MKFFKTYPDWRSLSSSFSQEKLPFYLIIAPKEEERRSLLSILSKEFSSFSDCKKGADLSQALLHLKTPSLFTSQVCAFVDLEKSLSKQEEVELNRYLQNPPLSATLIVIAAQRKQIGTIEGQIHGALIDLTGEKPWEEAKKCREWIVSWGKERGKRLAKEAIDLLVEGSNKDLLLLDRELEKLITYAKDKETIELKDVEAIGSFSLSSRVLEGAKRLIWEQDPQGLIQKEAIEIGELLPLIAFFRNQLEMGLKMAFLSKTGKTKEEIQKAFPKLWPKAFEEILTISTQKKEQYFLEGLSALFKLEIDVKQGAVDPENGMALFCAHFDKRGHLI